MRCEHCKKDAETYNVTLLKNPAQNPAEACPNDFYDMQICDLCLRKIFQEGKAGRLSCDDTKVLRVCFDEGKKETWRFLHPITIK